VTRHDANRIARRLGLPQEAVRTLQRHGLLQRLDLDEHELRRRLWRGHLAHLRRAASAQGRGLDRTATAAQPAARATSSSAG
jgi:hypothetical protein